MVTSRPRTQLSASSFNNALALLFQDAGIVAAVLRHTLLRNVAEDAAEMERAVMASGLDWTIVRPPRLTNAPLYRTLPH
jgi:uncharacterized protein YbjT (DUF2867 family)